MALLDVDGANRQAQEMLSLAAKGREEWVKKEQQEHEAKQRIAEGLGDAHDQTANDALPLPSKEDDKATDMHKASVDFGPAYSPSPSKACDEGQTFLGGIVETGQPCQLDSTHTPIMSSVTLNPAACAFIPGGKLPFLI